MTESETPSVTLKVLVLGNPATGEMRLVQLSPQFQSLISRGSDQSLISRGSDQSCGFVRRAPHLTGKVRLSHLQERTELVFATNCKFYIPHLYFLNMRLALPPPDLDYQEIRAQLFLWPPQDYSGC